MIARLPAVVLAVAVVLGVAVGVGAYTFVYAKGASYLTNNPAACMNCHIMREQYDAWMSGSHRSVAGCNDCHTPPGLVPKYLTKALNGFWHSFAFTSGHFHEPIQMTSRNRSVTEAACRNCHRDVVDAIDERPHAGRRLDCVTCHSSVGHLQ